MKLNKAAVMLDTGEQTCLCASAGAGTLEWYTENEAVAAVDAQGTVTAMGSGDTRIWAVSKRTSGEKEEAFCLISVDYQGQNPFLPPSWGLCMADGEPHVFDDVLYLYGSRDYVGGVDEEGGIDWCSADYHVIYTRDLIHWTDAGVCFRLEQIPEEWRNGGTRLWAPDLFRSRKDGNYYLLSCTNTSRYFIAESGSPIGPFVNPRLMTRNGEPIQVIDPGVLADDDGRVYLVGPDFFVAQLDPDDYSRILPHTDTDVKQWMSKDYYPFEGPSLRKRGDTYYYIYIADSEAMKVWHPCRMSYLTSKHPLGPYTYQDCFLTNRDYPNSVNIHGSFTEFQGQYYVFYHMPTGEMTLSRCACAEKLSFREDGTIVPALITSSGVKGCFGKNETIQASSGVVYSGGRGDCRARTRTKAHPDQANLLCFADYPYVFFDQEGQYIGYRYVDMTEVCQVELMVRTIGDGGVLLLRAGDTDLAEVTLPDTAGDWRPVSAPCLSAGMETLFLRLVKKPAQGEVQLDSFLFQ